MTSERGPAVRSYALIKLTNGDYLCPSNDGLDLWRFQRYIDGSGLGLDVSYRERDFWRASRAPFGAVLLADKIDIDTMAWTLLAEHLPSRRAAIQVMLDHP